MRDAGYVARRCEVCGAPLIGKRSDARFCSAVCKGAGAENRGLGNVVVSRTCDHCGVVYRPRNTRSKYCSKPCRKTASRKIVHDGQRLCPECGAGVERQSNAKYCSDECKHVRNLRVRREQWHEHGASLRGKPLGAAEYEDILRCDPCAYCGAPGTHLDHIVPRSRGGSDEWDNLTIACGDCNNRKGSRPLLEWLALSRMRSEWGLWVDIALGKRGGFPVRREQPRKRAKETSPA